MARIDLAGSGSKGNYVKVKLTVPPDLTYIFDVMDNQSVGLAIREALRSAVRPVHNHMKGIMRTALMMSEQSTGASERAVQSKVGRSRKNPNVFYALVGIDKSSVEIHSLANIEDTVTKAKMGKQQGIGLYAERAYKTRRGKIKTKQVFSRYRDTSNRFAKRKLFLKRRPSRYWHLINKGFRHRLGVRAKAYRFVEKTEAAMSTEAQLVFEERLKNLVVPVIIREIDRRIRSAASKAFRSS